MKKIVLLTGAALMAGLIAAPAMAEGWGGHKHHGDGEREGGRGGRMMHMMQMIDANADGVIGDDEAAAMAERMFNRFDADGNGELTLEEATTPPMRGHHKGGWMAWWKGQDDKATAPADAPKGSDQQAQGEANPPDDGAMPPRFAEMQERLKGRFAEADADKNNVVTKAEFMNAAKARFLAADADKDGKVTPWEFRSQQHL